MADAADFGRAMNEAEAESNKIIVDTYHTLLDNLSEEGAAVVDALKTELHKHTGSLQFDWEQQVQANPEIINNYARNCQG